MADRYQDRRSPDHYGRSGQNAPAPAESDPLAELARLIGQTDPFPSTGRTNQKPDSYVGARDEYEDSTEQDTIAPAGPPPWVQRAARHEPPRDQSRIAEHPLRRYAAAQPEAEPLFEEVQQAEAVEQAPDPSRYDEALYGPLDSGAQDVRDDPTYSDDPYAYPEGYGETAEDEPPKRRGMVPVLLILALAVVGTAGALTYRTFFGAPRIAEPPVIRADNSPTKIVPTPSDGSSKMLDRVGSGDGIEKIVPREEAPVDVNPRPTPRVVFPNPSGNPPAAASAGPASQPAGSTPNDALPSLEARKVRTLPVRGEQADASALPTGPSAAVALRPTTGTKTAMAAGGPVARNPGPTVSPNVSTTAPLSLAPQPSEAAPVAPATRLPATTSSAPTVPSTGVSGGYFVQVSSQRGEAEAQASYRALQGKFPEVLGPRPPVIKRADLGEKGIYYRAMVGPFGSPDEASQLCGSLKSAGGQCVIQRN
jgi:hypothetical protein